MFVPARYRIRFYDCPNDLNPAERGLRISPTTTVRELVSKIWGGEVFAYQFAAEIQRIEYVKLQFGTPSPRHKPAESGTTTTTTRRLPGFYVELYAERDHKKGSVFSRAAFKRQKHLANTSGMVRYQTRSVSQRQGRKVT
ncbi:hypothetical protein TWF594_000988 [Orbilia oligospora]|nr:hypothetical protein TWF706_005164 [Orbilia oligospora]KAF3148576.1 hypothetical protein TWF594_000988 [Orbilia oligospora]